MTATLRAQTASSDSIVLHYLGEQGIPVTYNNGVKLLKSGREKFDDLFHAIRQAKHHIHLEYFNFRNDSIARAVFVLLAQKVEEGVEVRVLFDAFGNMSNNRPLKKVHLDSIRASGIEMVKFDPIRFPWLNHIFHRDHRKIVVIDGEIGYTGGMNIADYYIHGLPKIGPWHDIHIRIKGEAVSYLQDIFLTMWNSCTKQQVEGPAYYPFRQREANGNEDGGNTGIAIIDRVPQKTPKIIRRMYVESINAAQKKIQIINPYFVPTHSIKKAIKKALRRGIKIEIMIPGQSDISFTPEASYYTVNSLRKKGAEIYIHHNGFHHSKIMMVDSLFCTIGSSNLNSRSLRFDYEVNAFVFDKATTNELSNIFEDDKRQSTFLTQAEYKKKSAWKRFVGWFAHLFIPVL